MIRGTEAEFKFQLPYNFSDLASAKIAFWQNDYSGPSIDRPIPIYKVLSQCSSTDNPKELCITLNMEETLRFRDDRKAYVQLRATTNEGISFASKEKNVTVYPLYDASVFGDDITPTPDYNNVVLLDGQYINV